MAGGMMRLVAMLWCLAASPSMAQQYSGLAHVVDGDTIEIGNVRIRFFGIDAPESKQACRNAAGEAYACGRASTDYLRRLIGNATVTCTDQGPAANNRRRGHCTARGVNLQQAMVSAGHAIVFRPHSEVYRPEEQAARAARRGVWSGTFRNPAEVRACRDQSGRSIADCSFD